MNFKSLIIILLLICLDVYAKWTSPQNIQLVNSEADDFAPQWNKRENVLYFNSNKTGYSKFYTFSFDTIGKVKLAKGRINQERNNQSFITFDNQHLISYFSNFKNAGRKSVLNIFYSHFEKSEWNEGILLNEFSSDYFTSHPTISPSGNEIVFSSSRASKDKETDLYISNKEQDGTWSEPQAIKEINSSGNEITPFLASDDTLYFSSDGFDGAGGYDIYFSVRQQGEWQKPTPLSDLNSEYNESDLIFVNSNHCIFASDKIGGKGKLDLYESKNIFDNTFENEIKPQVTIQSYTSVIRAKNNYTYSYNSLNQYIFFKENSAEIEMPSAQINLNDFKFSIYDFNYKISISIIAERLKKYSDAKIKISAWTPEIIELKNDSKENSKYIADTRINKVFEMFEYFGIDKSRFEINFNYFNPNSNEKYNYLFLNSNENELFDFVESKKDSISIEPSNLKIVINITPEKYSKDVTLEMNNGNKKLNISNVKKSKNEFDLNLTEHSSLLYDLDSINVVASLPNLNTFSYANFLIIHNESKTQDIIEFEGNKYFSYTVIAVNKFHFVNTYSLNKLKDLIKNSNQDKVKIFSSKSDESIDVADALVKYLKLKSNMQILKTEKFSEYDYINNHLFKIYIPLD